MPQREDGLNLCDSVVQELLLCIWLLCWMSPCFESSIQGVALTRFTHPEEPGETEIRLIKELRTHKLTLFRSEYQMAHCL